MLKHAQRFQAALCRRRGLKLYAAFWTTIAVFGVALGICETNAVAASSSTRVTILVVKSRESAFYTPTLQGFIAGLKNRGYDDGSGRDMKVIALTGDENKDQQILSADSLKSYHIIFTLGTDATRAVASEQPTVPCLFSMILDPISLEVAHSLVEPGGEFTGTTLQVSPGKQLDALQQVAPRVKRVGLLYTDGDPTSLGFLTNAEEDAKRLGLQIIAKPVGPENGESRLALETLAGQVDAFWLIVDPASVGREALLDTFNVAKAHHLPVLGTSSVNVRAGALVALSANLQDIGDVDAEMAVPLLRGTVSAGDTPVQGPRRTMLSINLDTAKALNLNVPNSVLQLADEVVDSSRESEN
jgi:putative ABC transport system substrate-binding protein